MRKIIETLRLHFEYPIFPANFAIQNLLALADCSAMGAGDVCVQADPVMGLCFSPKWV